MTPPNYHEGDQRVLHGCGGAVTAALRESLWEIKAAVLDQGTCWEDVVGVVKEECEKHGV